MTTTSTNPQQDRLQILLSHLFPHQPITNFTNATRNAPDLTNNHVPPAPSALNTSLIQQLTSLLDNNKTHEKQEFFAKYFGPQSIFAKEYDVFDLNTKEQKELCTRMFIQVVRDLNEIGWDNQEHLTWYLFEFLALGSPSAMTLYGAHMVLFTGALDKQGHDSLREKYLEKARNLQIWGCYAMTEISRGSYIRGMQTTADFDPERDEFVINTPGPNAMKFWIGGMGFDATHAVVFARLRTKGRDYGIHSFLVPLRSMEDHSPLPGIQIGDIGEKQGRNGISNGFCQFHGVRIPRDNMLMRWAQVSRDGTYTPSPKPELAYGALISGRVAVAMCSATEIKRAVTVAVRYASTRRQFHSKVSQDQSSKDETLLMDYQTHQARLIPHIATSYAQHFGAYTLHALNNNFLKDLDCLAKSSSGELNRQLLADVHALAAGMKATYSQATADAMLDCRQSLGGHGYSAYSGLAQYFNDFAAAMTFEGENTVLFQQTARQLLKDFTKCAKGGQVEGLMEYLNDYKQTLQDKCEAREFADFLDASLMLRALKYRSTKTIADCATHIKEYVTTTGSQSIAWNKNQYDLVNAARAFVDYFTAQCFMKAIDQPQNSPATKATLTALFNLFSLQILDKDIGSMIGGDGFLKPNHVSLIRRAFLHLCEELKEESMSLCEAFNLPDDFMPPVGKKDCKIYDNLFERIQKVPGYNQRPAYYEKVLKPLFSGKKE